MEEDKALEKQSIKVEVNPLQTAILMDLLCKTLPDIREIFAQHMPPALKFDFDAAEEAASEIYVKCYAETELIDAVRRTFETTGTVPDIAELLESRVKSDAEIPGPGEKKEIVIEVVPVHAMFAISLARGYSRQFFKMIQEHFSELVMLDFQAMIDSGEDIYEKSVGVTDIREKTAPFMEVFELTGQYPDLYEAFGKDATAN